MYGHSALSPCALVQCLALTTFTAVAGHARRFTKAKHVKLASTMGMLLLVVLGTPLDRLQDRLLCPAVQHICMHADPAQTCRQSSTYACTLHAGHAAPRAAARASTPSTAAATCWAPCSTWHHTTAACRAACTTWSGPCSRSARGCHRTAHPCCHGGLGGARDAAGPAVLLAAAPAAAACYGHARGCHRLPAKHGCEEGIHVDAAFEEPHGCPHVAPLQLHEPPCLLSD